MVSIEGDIKPFRITREVMIEFLSQITKEVNFRQISLEVERFSTIHSTMEDIDEFLRDLRLPSVVNNMSIWIYGKLTVYFIFNKDYATYDISNAKNIDEARHIEDLIVSFFEKYKTFRLFSTFPGMLICGILFIIGFIEIFVFEDYLSSTRIVTYPFLHLFVGLICLTLVIYILWSRLTRETPSFSFVHSIMFLKERKSSVLWALIFSIIMQIAIAIITTYMTTQPP